MDIAEVLQFMHPKAEFVVSENNLDSIIWHTKGITTPTMEEIEESHKKMIADRLEQAKTKANARQAILDKLGLSVDEMAALLA